VTLVGSALSHVKWVHFGSASGTSVKVLSSTKLQVTSPKHTAGTVDIRVATAIGTSTAHTSDHFRYVAPPSVSAITPASGGPAGGTRLTVSGASFIGVTSVRFGTHTGSAVSVHSSTSLSVTAPAGSLGLVDVRVVTRYGTSPSVAADQYAYKTDTLTVGQALSAGQALTSADGRYAAVMQTDGNFVVYGPSGALWATGTGGTGSNVIVMQADGNLVVYAPGGVPHWSSNTAPSYQLRLVMQNDGNLVLYGPNGIPIWDRSRGRVGSEDTLGAGGALGVGRYLVSTDGHYSAVMQSDGNFVVYGPSGATWATGTSGSGNVITMQGDGNLVVYSSGGTALWSSATAPSSGDRLVMQTDGNLVIYDGTNTALWALGSVVDPFASKLDAFVAQWNGKYADYDGLYGAQCVDLFNFYNRDVVHASFASVDYAYQLYDTYDTSKYTRLAASATPRKGDVAIWASNLPFSGGAGHVAMVMSISGSTLTIFTQNPGPAQIATMSTAYLRGYLRPHT
jgi:hypothetical protein